MDNKQIKKLEESLRLDPECQKCKKYRGICNGRMAGKAIPCLCYEEKSK